jgi:hypothetical protein
VRGRRKRGRVKKGKRGVREEEFREITTMESRICIKAVGLTLTTSR